MLSAISALCVNRGGRIHVEREWRYTPVSPLSRSPRKLVATFQDLRGVDFMRPSGQSPVRGRLKSSGEDELGALGPWVETTRPRSGWSAARWICHAEIVACAPCARPGLRGKRSPETPSSPRGATTRGEA